MFANEVNTVENFLDFITINMILCFSGWKYWCIYLVVAQNDVYWQQTRFWDTSSKYTLVGVLYVLWVFCVQCNGSEMLYTMV